MPMPNPQLLFAFIKHYYDIKTKIKSSTMYGMLLNAGQSMHLISDHAEDRKPKIEDITKKISNAETVDQWIDIALECGEQAEEGQAEKTWKGDCDYAKVMHAMRAYIIAEIMADAKLKPDLDAAIKRRLTILEGNPTAKDEALRLGTRESYHLDVVKGYDLTPAITAYKKSLLELANLGQLRYCSEAVLCQFTKLAFYDPLEIKKEYKGRVNPKIPICYQSTYHILYYLDEGLKASTKDLPGNLTKTELLFSTYVESLKNPNITDVIAAELLHGNSGGHDFPDQATSPQLSQSPQISRPASRPVIASRPAASLPPQPSDDSESTATLAAPPPPLRQMKKPTKPAGKGVPTLFAAQDFPPDGSSPWQRPTSAPQAPDAYTEEKGARSPSLKKSGEYDS